MVGALGTVAGVTELLDTDAVLVPLALVAVTVNVYVVPLVRPVTIIGDPVPLAVIPPGLDVTVYVVIGPPPVFAGGVNVIVTCPLPLVATTFVGASGVP